MKPKRLFRCSVCEDVLTEEEWEEYMETGGSGYCMCGFTKIDGEGEAWFPRVLREYDVYLLKERNINEQE